MRAMVSSRRHLSDTIEIEPDCVAADRVVVQFALEDQQDQQALQNQRK
jgi:hypothetical protein